MARNEVIDNDKGWGDLIARVQAMRGQLYVKVGILADSDRGGLHEKGPDGKAAPLTVAEIAAVNEFGTGDGHIPARPFLRMTFDRFRPELEQMIPRLVTKLLFEPNVTADSILHALGQRFGAEVRKTITDGEGVPPENAESTKASKNKHRRGNKRFGVRTLIDTGRLYGAIAYALVRGGQQQEAQYASKR